MQEADQEFEKIELTRRSKSHKYKTPPTAVIATVDENYPHQGPKFVTVTIQPKKKQKQKKRVSHRQNFDKLLSSDDAPLVNNRCATLSFVNNDEPASPIPQDSKIQNTEENNTAIGDQQESSK